MLKVSEIISKQVVSVYECENIGVVKNVVFNSDFKKIAGFVFFNDEMENESFVSLENAYSFTNDGLLVKNLSKIGFSSQIENNPINKKVFALNGTCLGKICDIEFDKKGFVSKFLTSQTEVLPTQIFKVGHDTVIVNLQEEKQVKITSFKPKQNFNKENEILDTIKVKLVKMDTLQQNQTAKKEAPKFPAKIKPDLLSLVGKKAVKTIIGLNNEIIIKQNNVISKHTLDMAKLHNKTYELMFNSI